MAVRSGEWKVGSLHAMIEPGDLRYSILVGEKVLPVLFEALQLAYGELYAKRDCGAELSGAQILAEHLIDLLETDCLMAQIVREASPGKGPEGYFFKSSHDHGWESWEQARDEFAAELEKGGEILITPMPSHFAEDGSLG